MEERGLLKLINTYIDKLPKCISEVDGRLHASFHQVGTATGRFSSSDPNLQNIPSKADDIRMMFTAATDYNNVDVIDNVCKIPNYSDVLIDDEWVNVKQVNIGDVIELDDSLEAVTNINRDIDYTYISF